MTFDIGLASAKEITILYTGETHAMLYPCHCPKEPDGGVSRRASLIRQLRKKHPQALLFDSGAFFAGGNLDEYTQNTELDTQRTLVNLRAMELMKYDAVAVGDEEFNFGMEFLEENVAKSRLAFLSCNIKSGKIAPFIIKEVQGVKVGITAVTNAAVKAKAQSIEFIEPKPAVEAAVQELKKKGAEIIVLLSHLNESESHALVRDVPGIDILIAGHNPQPGLKSGEREGVLVLRPTWQARHLGKATVILKDKKISDVKIEDLGLSGQIKDDPGIGKILPQCFSDKDCRKDVYSGTCSNPGNMSSVCTFPEEKKVSLLVITSRSCMSCDTSAALRVLRNQFPGVEPVYLYYPQKKAKDLVDDLGIIALPVYLLGKEVEVRKSFSNFKVNLEPRGDYYMLKPQFSGLSFFLKRERISGRLDLFFSIFDKDAPKLLEAIRGFDPALHFLAQEEKGGFAAAAGEREVEEYLRLVCVRKYYPENFWGYLTCRARNINSSWWEDCLGSLDAQRIRACARGNEGRSLLRENTALNKELQILFGPTYLLDNREIFSVQGEYTKEGLKKILKR
ncbi:MAG: bifunctional metallophosphatase/5'-nucleotidase [Candidatus Omnitrophica bacterium]|nr:bifunctional metallophosphatase/5'-nucleotidase [Candidatus Omnitrophota bacterium]